MKRCFRNVIGLALVTVLAAIVSSATPTPSLASAIPVLTYHYNNARTGANTSETILTPANVNVSHFGKLFSLPVDGGIYDQPLYVPNVAISGKLYNVVYVATRNNSIYAFDADNGAMLWSKNLGPTQPPPQNCTAFGNVGIFGTPVITGNIIYVVAATLRSGLPARQELHAL